MGSRRMSNHETTTPAAVQASASAPSRAIIRIELDAKGFVAS